MNKKTKPTKPVTTDEVNLKIPIAAPQAAVWKALVNETGLWWPKDFHTSARTKRFVIEPKLGGRAYEDAGKGEGLIWYSVVGVERPDLLLLAGSLFPPYGGPATSQIGRASCRERV